MKLSERDEWPSLRIEFEFCPWAWTRPRFYRDDIPHYVSLEILGVKLTFSANVPMFWESP